MKNRISIIFLVFVLILNSIVVFAETVETNDNDGRVEYTDIGLYDVWKHSDGTWQYGIKPNSNVDVESIIDLPIPEGVKPVNFEVKFEKDIVSKRGILAMTYQMFAVNNMTITDFEYLGDGKSKWKINTDLVSNVGKGTKIREEWQLENVEGYEYYLPLTISWQYEDGLNEILEQDSNSDDLITFNYSKNATFNLQARLDSDNAEELVENETVTVFASVLETGETYSDIITLDELNTIEANRFTVELPFSRSNEVQTVQYRIHLNEDELPKEIDYSDNVIFGSYVIPSMEQSFVGCRASGFVGDKIGARKTYSTKEHPYSCGNDECNSCPHYAGSHLHDKELDDRLYSDVSINIENTWINAEWGHWHEAQEYAEKIKIGYATQYLGNAKSEDYTETRMNKTVNDHNLSDYIRIDSDKLFEQGLRDAHGIRYLRKVMTAGRGIYFEGHIEMEITVEVAVKADYEGSHDEKVKKLSDGDIEDGYARADQKAMDYLNTVIEGMYVRGYGEVEGRPLLNHELKSDAKAEAFNTTNDRVDEQYRNVGNRSYHKCGECGNEATKGEVYHVYQVTHTVEFDIRAEQQQGKIMSSKHGDNVPNLRRFFVDRKTYNGQYALGFVINNNFDVLEFDNTIDDECLGVEEEFSVYGTIDDYGDMSGTSEDVIDDIFWDN